MNLFIRPEGFIETLYDETIDPRSLGVINIRRASHVEPDAQGHWWADLSPVHGPKLGPYASRSQAIKAEEVWLTEFLTISHAR